MRRLRKSRRRFPAAFPSVTTMPIDELRFQLEALGVRSAVTIAAEAVLEAAAPTAFAAELASDGSALRAGASGRRRASCRAGRPRPRSSSARPRRPPCCRRARAGAPPDRPASALIIGGLGGIHPRIGAIDPHLGEIPHRGLDRRPQLFLIGRQLQPGMHRRDPRIGQGRPVLRAHVCRIMRRGTTRDAGHKPRSKPAIASAATPASRTSSCQPPLKGGLRMSVRPSAINLQFGNRPFSYQDLIPFTIGNTQMRPNRLLRSCRAAAAATAKSPERR